MNFQERYRLVRELSSNGKGKVFLVFDEKLAIYKVMKSMDSCGRAGMERIRQQFISEILLMKDLSHPCLPHVTDFFVDERSVCMVMDYVEGQNLKDYRLDKGPIEEDQIIEWGLQLTDLFSYLHGRNPPIYHRDLKPSNLICHPSGRLVLLDFGIACEGKRRFMVDAQGQDQVIWQIQAAEGTVGFAAPEQYGMDAIIDERSDIYSLGRTLLYCLAGPNMDQNDGRISLSLRHFLEECCREDPSRRFANMEMVREKLLVLRNRKRKISVTMKKDILKFVGGFLIFIGLFLGFTRYQNQKKAVYYVHCAQESIDRDKMLDFYEKALCLDPSQKAVYASICQEWIKPNHFSQEDATSLMNLFEKTASLPAFARYHPKQYAQFSYQLGLAYFYDMGGSQGKKESVVWFERALNHERLLEGSQARRGEIYRQIGTYYDGFLTYGKDLSKEKEEADYKKFFQALCQLNDSTRDFPEDPADQMAACMAAKEVAEEIYFYSRQFMEEGISAGSLKKELNDVRTYSQKNNQMEQKQKEELLALIANALDRIDLYGGKL